MMFQVSTEMTDSNDRFPVGVERMKAVPGPQLTAVPAESMKVVAVLLALTGRRSQWKNCSQYESFRLSLMRSGRCLLAL